MPPVLPGPTERLTFRLWRPEDRELAEALWGDARITAFVGGPFDADHAHRWLLEHIGIAERAGVQYFPIFLRDGMHAGCCGLRPRTAGDAPFELGFYLRPEHHGRGLATEAARAVIEHAFSTLDAAVLFAGHHPDNVASRALLTRLGFVENGRELYPPTGLEHPAYLLSRPVS